MGGEPGIAIVEADHLQAAVGEGMAKRVRPVNRLRGDPHDEQHERRVGAAEPLVGDVDPGRPHVRYHPIREIEPVPLL